MQTVKTESDIDINVCGDIYVKRENIKVWKGADSITITDLSNALKRGAKCKQVTVRAWNEGVAVINYVKGQYKATLDKETDKERREGKLNIYVSYEDGRRTFSPFALGNIKPLKETPNKWTIPHVIRAIINGQFTGLKCNGVYTDDYAFDAAYDFQKGNIKTPLEFCKGIIESPSGWWTSERDGVVSISCHSFDYNEFTPAIKRAKVAA